MGRSSTRIGGPTTYIRPLSAYTGKENKSKHKKYTQQEKADVVWLVQHGWRHLDIAVAYGIPIYIAKSGRYASGVSGRYEAWRKE